MTIGRAFLPQGGHQLRLERDPHGTGGGGFGGSALM
jgi:hypothetical protein